MNFPRFTKCLILSVSVAACGGKTEVRTERVVSDLEAFHALKDLDAAPLTLQTAAKAITLIQAPEGANGTGFFISKDGLLMSNEHVLGAHNCPREGCFVSLDLAFDKKSVPKKPTQVYAVPQTAATDLDISVFKIFNVVDGQKGGSFQSPHFLTFEKKTSKELMEQDIYVIGHPLGQLKKWSGGQVFLADGKWFHASNFALAGNSGSPFLSKEGNVIGILHRGPDSMTQVTRKGVRNFSIGTSSHEIQENLKTPNVTLFRDLSTLVEEEDFLNYQHLFFATRRGKVSLDDTEVHFADLHLKKCEDALKISSFTSRNDMVGKLAACERARNWMSCQKDADSHLLCPESIQKWKDLFAAYNLKVKEFTGAESLFWAVRAPEVFSTTPELRQQENSARLEEYLQREKPMLDWPLTTQLIIFGKTNYQNKDLFAHVKKYQADPLYEYSIRNIGWSFYFMGVRGVLKRDEVIHSLNTILTSDKITLAEMLWLETLIRDWQFSQ